MVDMPTPGDTPTTLDEWLNARLVDLDLQWKDLISLARLGGRQTLKRIRETGRMRPQTARRIEIVMGWEPGSIAAIARGEAPTVASTYVSPDADSDAEARLREHLRELRRAGMKRDALIRVVMDEIAAEVAREDRADDTEGDGSHAAR
jgi:hypothetical protein